MALTATGVASADPLVGVASVIDGDTIEIHATRIRFNGIDAPEARQLCSRDGKPWRCGSDAANALDTFLDRRTVSCERKGTDRYKRVVGRCQVDGMDLNTWMVRNGWAVDYERYSKGEYQQAQEAAARERVGIWASTFVMPWDWRKGAR
ncbi:MAG: thermonuclease family protein [Pseudomonadota bacterium]|nr:thermonuclease family protein [Pseudomonadota bacterium]